MSNETTYIVFMYNARTGEEFTAPKQGPKNAHPVIMGEMRKEYPAPQFKILTAYTVEELESTLKNLDRWAGLPSRVQAGQVKQAKVRVSTRMDKPIHIPEATSGHIQHTQLKAKNVQPQTIQPTKNPFAVQATQPTQQKSASQPQVEPDSIFMRLKAMREAGFMK